VLLTSRRNRRRPRVDLAANGTSPRGG